MTKEQLFLADITRIMSKGYETYGEAECVLRNIGAYEVGTLYRVDLRGVGSFYFGIKDNGVNYSILMASAIPNE